MHLLHANQFPYFVIIMVIKCSTICGAYYYNYNLQQKLPTKHANAQYIHLIIRNLVQ